MKRNENIMCGIYEKAKPFEDLHTFGKLNLRGFLSIGKFQSCILLVDIRKFIKFRILYNIVIKILNKLNSVINMKH